MSPEYRSTEIPKAEVQALKEALPDTFVDSTHYSTAGTWRYINGKTMHPHYKVITQIFGENHQKPGTGYTPFAESYPLESEDADDEPDEPAETSPAATSAPLVSPMLTIYSDND